MSLLFSFLGRFPLNVLHALGALLGWFTWLVSPTYRRRMRDNMRQAGLAAAGAAAIAEAGKSLLELPFIWGRPVAEVLASVHQVCGMEILQEAQKQGHPILFLTPHLGCFEVLGPFLGSRRPLTALYRPSKLAWVEECIRKGRGRFVTLASADRSGVRLLLAAIIAIYHFTLIRARDRTQCFKAFLHNNWLGAVIFIGLAVDFRLNPMVMPLR